MSTYSILHDMYMSGRPCTDSQRVLTTGSLALSLKIHDLEVLKPDWPSQTIKPNVAQLRIASFVLSLAETLFQHTEPKTLVS